MKKLQFLNFLFAALLLVTLVSCDNDGDDDATPSKAALLTGGVWTGDKLYYQGMDVTEDFSDFYDVKTVTIKFDTDGTYTSEAEGTEDEGTWEFASNETQVILDKDTDDEIEVDINKLTASELHAEGDFFFSGGTETFEIRFVR